MLKMPKLESIKLILLLTGRGMASAVEFTCLLNEKKKELVDNPNPCARQAYIESTGWKAVHHCKCQAGTVCRRSERGCSVQLGKLSSRCFLYPDSPGESVLWAALASR